MSKFVVGEIAIFVAQPDTEAFIGRLVAGDEVEIVRTEIVPGDILGGPAVDGVLGYVLDKEIIEDRDYECRHPSGFHFLCHERHLRKRPQRGIPDDVRAWFDVPRKVGEPA